MHKTIYSCMLSLALLLFTASACFAGSAGIVISVKGEAFNDVVVPSGFKAASSNLTPSAIPPQT